MQQRLGIVLAVLMLLPAAPAAADAWRRVESPNFVVYTDFSPKEARQYVETLELFDRALRARHGLETSQPAARKLPIYLPRSRRDLQKVRPRRDDVVGFYASGMEDTFAVAAGRDDTVLQHEYVHHFMLQHFPYGYPAWLVEGYAEYFMTFEAKPGQYEVGRANPNRVHWLAHGRWLPFERVVKVRPSDLRSSENAAMFYAQSWALTHYFLSDPERQKQLGEYLGAMARGVDSLAAMEAATGGPIGGLDRKIREYLQKGLMYQRVGVAEFAPPALTVTELPASAEDVLLLTQRVKTDNGVDAPEDKTDGPVLLAEARRAAAAHPGDRAAELLQARAEIKLGDLTAAEILLQKRLQADPKDVEALQLLAAARFRAAAEAPDRARALHTEIRDIAGRAFKLDPTNYPTLVAYVRARQGLKSYPNDNDLGVLLDAVELAPQVGAIRMNAAIALDTRRRYKDAAAILRPLAFDPHGGTDTAAARALIAALEAKLAKSPDEAGEAIGARPDVAKAPGAAGAAGAAPAP